MSGLQICSAICCFVGLLLLLISFGSDYGVVNGNVNVGLWKFCILSVCSALAVSVGAAIHATRAFMLMGVIAGAVSFFGLCTTLLKSEGAPTSLTKSSTKASILAALCAMTAMAIFTGNTSSKHLFGWSFNLGWASFPLFLIGGVMDYLSRSASS